MRLNYDVFYMPPQSVNEMHCRVCGSRCFVQRNYFGPSDFSSAMGQVHQYWDRFACPNSESPWHEQALSLVVAIDETPSKRLAELMRLDLEDILKENKQ